MNGVVVVLKAAKGAAEGFGSSAVRERNEGIPSQPTGGLGSVISSHSQVQQRCDGATENNFVKFEIVRKSVVIIF